MSRSFLLGGCNPNSGSVLLLIDKHLSSNNINAKLKISEEKSERSVELSLNELSSGKSSLMESRYFSHKLFGSDGLHIVRIIEKKFVSALERILKQPLIKYGPSVYHLQVIRAFGKLLYKSGILHRL